MSLLLHPLFAKVVSSRSRAHLEGLKKSTNTPLCGMVGKETSSWFQVSERFNIYLHTSEQVTSALIYIEIRAEKFTDYHIGRWVLANQRQPNLWLWTAIKLAMKPKKDTWLIDICTEPRETYTFCLTNGQPGLWCRPCFLHRSSQCDHLFLQTSLSLNRCRPAYLVRSPHVRPIRCYTIRGTCYSYK